MDREFEPGRYRLEIFQHGMWEDYAKLDEANDLPTARRLIRLGSKDPFSGERLHYRLVDSYVRGSDPDYEILPSISFADMQETKRTGVHPHWKIKGGPSTQELWG